MKRLFLIIMVVLLILLVSACKSDNERATDRQITVAVAIVPEAAFVEAVAGDLAQVVTLIPPGYSPANYQPTTMQMQALSDASVYFTLQMPAEQANILPKVEDFNKGVKIVDLRSAAAEVYPLLTTDGTETAITESGDYDPHVWLSPKRAIVMVKKIADELSGIDETNKELYQQNAASYIEKLEELDNEIQKIVSGMENKTFLIYHGAYGYFAHDYGLKMISIEIGGKQATAQELKQVINYAKENNIKTVFYQDEFDDSQAKTVAEEIGGTVGKAAPLSFDYLQGLRDFANALLQPGEQHGQ